MDPFILIVGGILLLVGSVIALAWWKLASKAAPYRDEQLRPTPEKTDDAEVIVIGQSGQPKRGG